LLTPTFKGESSSGIDRPSAGCRADRTLVAEHANQGEPIAMPGFDITITPEEAGATLAAILRAHLADHSWNQVRRLVAARRVKVGGDLCQDPARRLHAGEQLSLLASSIPKEPLFDAITIRHLDDHFVVVEKPSGMSSVRHPAERDWNERRKSLTPTLEDVVPRSISQAHGRSTRGALPRLRIVQRLDKETSGLVVFARSVAGERELGRQFRKHTVTRRYLAIVPGRVIGQRIESSLVRDRGDGRRGSTHLPSAGKVAITHVNVEEELPGYVLLSCRLETGRTHQIRIHLAELGHPVCGDKVYNRRPDGSIFEDRSGFSRLALHAVELGFAHPITGAEMHWTMPLPPDLQSFLDRLRGKTERPGDGD
jgi:23S rRNA pseudouridine1911/1915/1917 synthase